MKYRSKVLSKRIINKDTLVLELEKGDIRFKAGQYLVLSFPNEKEAREYSVYNGENASTIEILIKTLPEGSFSMRLGDLNVGDPLLIDGPFGFFVMKEHEVKTKPHVFIASGTGISPFRSYIQTYSKLNYHLLHGIRKLDDRIEPENYPDDKLTYCISRETSPYFNGRVTDYLKQQPIDKQAIYHLCGNSAMINDVTDLLETNGIRPENIRTEVFF
ncbi:MAG: oxidoreductase [Bacteroidetes bacterium HGW-Bacteroidetes-4]|jgi:ferredoxin-NADP reductase|nr:MAG: oxidoreductase [Bacteroidetes bacterium HGW-Bacteroidetes-4]